MLLSTMAMPQKTPSNSITLPAVWANWRKQLRAASPAQKLRGLFLLLGALVFSCMPQSQVVAPDVEPSSTLALAEEDASKPVPFQLVHAAPQGPTNSDPVIHLVFSHPLRGLDADAPVPAGITLHPDVAGEWQWLGVYGLTFSPQGGSLPRATAFQVSVPGDLKDTEGETLGASESFSFSTPVPQVTHAAPNQSWSAQRPEDRIVLTFSQPVDAEKLRPFLHVSAGDAAIADLQLASGSQADQLVVWSKAGWPLDSLIEYEVRPGYPGQEGPQPATALFRGKFRTYGPLVATVECDENAQGACRPEGGLRLSLSNPVNALKLGAAVSATGARLEVDRDWSPHAEINYLTLAPSLTPRAQFTVNLGPIRDQYGQTLKWIKGRQVRVGDLRPRVLMGFSGDSIPLAEKKLSVVSVNASSELSWAPLSQAELTQLAQLRGKEQRIFFETLPSRQVRQLPAGGLNQYAEHQLALDDITEHGAFALAVNYQSEGRPVFDLRWAQRTNLGLTVKQGRDQSLVWVTDLLTGAPVQGAEVRLPGKAAKVAASTDARGIARLPAGEFVSRADHAGPAEWLQVSAKGDQVLRSNQDAMGEWSLPVQTDFYGSTHDQAELFLERDLFRPGESGSVKGYLRRPIKSGNLPLAGERVELVLQAPDGSEVSRSPVVTNEYGAFGYEITVPGASPLGYFSLTLERQGQRLTSAHLQVAEFRPAEFEVQAHSPVSSVIAGDPVGWNVTGSYFSGGVMANSSIATTVARRPASFDLPGAKEFITDDSAWQMHEPYQFHDPLLAASEVKLDDFGKWSGETASRLEKQVGPERLELEATVRDLSGQAQSSRASVLVHPAAHYVAIARPETTLLDTPARVSPQIKTLSPEGKTVAGQAVQLQLYRLRWVAARQSQGHHSSYWHHELVRDLVGSCSLTTAPTARSCPLEIRDAGQYVLRASSRDAQGRVTVASLSYSAVGEGVASFRDDGDRGRVELTLDRELYLPGQSARVLVASPFQSALAWVTVERDGIFSERLVRLSGSTPTITVPIDESMRPGAFVSVHLIEDRAAAGNEAHQLSESFRLGYAELRIDPERQRLEVEVTSDERRYRPGEDVELSVRVRDQAGQGRKSEVTLFVVDEGVLTLSGYQMPDPLEAFTRPRPLRVETIEGRQSLARLFGIEAFQREQKGAPGGGGGDSRSEFVTAAYFNPSLITDSSGRASARFTLPDNVGRFRIMALAVTVDDRYGQGQSSFEVNRPLMLRPALPRFLRAGDEVELATVVSALGFAGGPVTVRVEAEGVVLEEEREQVLDLKPGQSRLVRFGARAAHPGNAQVRFSVSAGGAVQDAVLQSRPLRSPAVLETVALYGKTEDAVAHRLGALEHSRKDMGGLEVTLSSSALVGLEGGFEQLWDYPYLCSEQLASRILPLVVLGELAQLYGVDLPEDADARVASAVSTLVRRQRGDGGFGMWPESQESHPWVSAYALWTLREAQARGSVVSDTVFERGVRFLSGVAAERAEQSDEGEHHLLAQAAFASFALAQVGHGDVNTVMALTDRVDQMGPEAVALLLLAATATEGARNATQILQKRVASSVSVRGNRAEVAEPNGRHPRTGNFWPETLGSPTRLHALTLLSLVRAQAEHAMAAPLVRGLLDARKRGTWASTQESAFALLALDAYRRAQEADEPQFDAFAFLGEQLLGKKRFVGRSVQAQSFFVERGDLRSEGQLAFQKKGRGTLFYEARLKTARLHLPVQALERGFMVTKRVRPVRDLQVVDPAGERATQSIPHGELALIEVSVLAPNARRFVVVDDPLPAGLEAVDLSQDTAQGMLRTLLERTPGTSWAWHRTELRDDRVLQFVDDMKPGVYEYKYLARATTRGSFVVPPTVTHEMYQEEISGRTAASQLEVR